MIELNQLYVIQNGDKQRLTITLRSPKWSRHSVKGAKFDGMRIAQSIIADKSHSRPTYGPNVPRRDALTLIECCRRGPCQRNSERMKFRRNVRELGQGQSPPQMHGGLANPKSCFLGILTDLTRSWALMISLTHWAIDVGRGVGGHSNNN